MTAISVSERLLEMAAFYTPLALTVTLLLKYAIIDGVLDEDLYQELSIILLKAIKLFKI